MLRRRWLKELARWSRIVSDRRLLRGSEGRGSRKKIKKMIQNKFRRIEKLLKDCFPMDSGGEDRWKEKEKIRGRLGIKKDTTTVPRQRRQKACWVF